MSANQTDPQFKLRVPPELKVKIEESAKAHNRSMNADMVARLEKSFDEGIDANIAGLLDEMRRLQTELRETRLLYAEAQSRNAKQNRATE